MSYFDDYKNRVLYKGTTVQEQMLNNVQDFISNTFFNAPSIKLVKHNGQEIYARVTPLSLRSSLYIVKSNYRQVYFENLKELVLIGDVFEFDGDTWLCFDIVKTSGVCFAIVVKCNASVLVNNITIPCAVNKDTEVLSEKKYLMIPSDEVICWIKYDTVSESLKLNQLVTLNDTVWKITGIDNVSKVYNNSYGLLQLYLKYYSGLETNTSFPSASIIKGSDVILVNTQQTYKIYNAGNYTFNWTIDNSLASIIGSDATSCVIKAGNSSGTFTLTATCVEDNTIVLTKTVTIQASLW